MSGFVVVAVITVAYALVATRLDRLSIGAPIVFMLLGVVVGPAVLDLLTSVPDSEAMRVLTEATLALLLFCDASTVRMKELEGDAGPPVRLLLVGLPLTVVAGTLVAGLILPTLGWVLAALLGAILAPTDAALSLPVVTDRRVPSRVRRILNVESGLNDGLATPIIAVLLAVAASDESGTAGWGRHAVTAIGVAVAVALVVGLGGGWAMRLASTRGWTNTQSDQLATIALAASAYVGSVWLGGNGFVAAFVAGLLFGTAYGRPAGEPTEYAEQTGMFLSFAVWVLFGVALAGPLLTQDWHWGPIACALLSLTVVRMLPVALALAGSGLRPATVGFIGWFGPRGLASVVFLIMAVDELDLTIDNPLVQAAGWTILLSVLFHGLSAAPLASAYNRRLEAQAGSLAEHAPGPDPRSRRRGLLAP